MKILKSLACLCLLSACSTPLTPQQKAAVDTGAAIGNLALDYYASKGKAKPEDIALGHAVIGIAQHATDAGKVGAVVVVPTASTGK